MRRAGKKWETVFHVLLLLLLLLFALMVGSGFPWALLSLRSSAEAAASQKTRSKTGHVLPAYLVGSQCVSPRGSTHCLSDLNWTQLSCNRRLSADDVELGERGFEAEESGGGRRPEGGREARELYMFLAKKQSPSHPLHSIAAPIKLLGWFNIQNPVKTICFSSASYSARCKNEVPENTWLEMHTG